MRSCARQFAVKHLGVWFALFVLLVISLVLTEAPLSAGRSRNLRLLGALNLGGFNADVWGHGDFAYVGTWGRINPARPDQCPGTGVKIIDISDPTTPVWVASAAARPGTSAEDMMVERINTRFFHGDLLAVGIQRCAPLGQGVEGGLDLWDVSDPRNPVHLSFLALGERTRGVHELYLFKRGNRAYALLAHLNAERVRLLFGIDNGLDFKIADVTDPRDPVIVGQWGAFESLGILPTQGQGADIGSFAHSVSADQTGRLAFLSYADTGMVILDISDPEHPSFLGRSSYQPHEEGNGHSAIAVPGNRFAVVTDEDGPFGPPGTEPGWGYARIFDISDPTNPIQISTFATTNSRSTRTDGEFTVHNPFIRGRTLYLSWYSDGLRVVDLSRPSAPEEIASFVPPAHPDPFGFFDTVPLVWGVWVGGDTILLSDINFGLYVLKHQP